MSQQPHLFNLYGQGIAANGPTLLSGPALVPAGTKARVTDISFGGDSLAYVWLSTSADPTNVPGRRFGLVLPGAGFISLALESPIELDGSTALYAHYDTLNAGTYFAGACQGELYN